MSTRRTREHPWHLSTMALIHEDIVELDAAYQAIEADARRLVASLDERTGTWQPRPGSWSVAECLDHLATSKRVYLSAMRPPAERALAQGRLRRGPARPGLVGGWFVRSLEPPATGLLKMKAPGKIRPRPAPPLSSAAADFFESHAAVRAFLQEFAGLDLSGVRFPNPFITGVRFSLATGLHVIAAHDRRHLWQAERVKKSSAEFGVRSAE